MGGDVLTKTQRQELVELREAAMAETKKSNSKYIASVVMASSPGQVGAWLDAILAGASEYDADDIANVIATRPRPSYEERLAVFKPTGRPEPSREPFPILSKGGGGPTF